MPLEDFDLAPPAPDPLDMGGFVPMPGPVAGRQPQAPQGGTDKRALLKLAMLIPMAMKAGPGAMQGLLAGWQQAQQQKQAQGIQQGRFDAQQGQQEAQQASLDQYRNAQIEQQTKARQQALLKQFGDAVATMDDPNAVRALLDLYGGQAEAIGLDRPSLERYAMTVATPTSLQKKAAEKRIAALKSQHGEKWMETGARFTHELGGEKVPFDVLLARAGYERDPNAQRAAPVSAIAPDVPLDRQHAMAVASGNETLAKQIESAMQRQDMAKSQPVDPQLAGLNRQIAEMRLENLKGAKDTSGLPPRVQRQVDAQAKGFDSQPVTKRTQVMAEAVAFAKALKPTTKNPADDQALIYAFAKAMDPDSVVREGEYATVQKYAQSWAEQFQFNAARVFSNTAFLTPEARANMKATIEARYQAARSQYDNVRREYGARISRITGQPDGESYLIDYGAAFPSVGAPAGAPTNRERVLPPSMRTGGQPAPAAAPQRIGRFEVTVEP